MGRFLLPAHKIDSVFARIYTVPIENGIFSGFNVDAHRGSTRCAPNAIRCARASLLFQITPQDRELQFVFCASAEMANDGEVKSLMQCKVQLPRPSRPRRHPAPWLLILRCAHAPNLARGVVCGHKNRSGSYGNKIALICMKIELVC